MTNGKALESDIREFLERTLPASTLSSVCLFQVDQFVQGRNFGSEIDHLLHFQAEDGDHLLLIECKAQPIQFRGTTSNEAVKEWIVYYGEEPKFLKKQLFAQAQALLQNLYPRERARSITVHAMVVSNAASTPSLRLESSSGSGIFFYLSSLDSLLKILEDPRNRLTALLEIPAARWRPLRVQQSDILRRVRHSLVLPELGHPEVPNGMRYVARCREALDCELTRYFRPTSEGRWVINGGAGMGKTVLLAYAAIVFATDHVITEKRADRQLPKRELVAWTTLGIVGKLPPPAKRKVVLLGLNHKQRDVLNREKDRFAQEFQRIADAMDESHLGSIPQHPRVEVWREGMTLKADVLLIDEAHDLSFSAQTAVREWWEKGAGNRYLVLACDRHQKLRLLGENASILEGVSFSGCSVRLTRNYRSPSPIYGASIGLMFRWFGNGGVKVLPTQADLTENFGFYFEAHENLPEKPGSPVILRLKSDVHPANYWCFTVARYTHWQVAYNWLEEWGLNEEQVLWVRCSHTDRELAQQDLKRVQLRDLMGNDPDHVIDAHIKGREFPVVVIEGLPSEGVDQRNEAEMLLWRRRLYLCASRATCFLFFVYPGPDGSETSRAWNEEILNLLRSCSAPVNRTESSSKFWELRFDFPETLRRPEVFVELENTVGQAAESKVSVPASPNEPTSTLPAPSPPAVEPAPPPPAVPLPSATQTTLVASPPKPLTTPEVATSLPAVEEPTPRAHAPSNAANETAKPPRLSEKEFQRMYGQEKGWKLLYARYCETNNLPTHIKPQIKRTSPAPTAPTFTKSYSLPSVPEPKLKSIKPTQKILAITPRLISRQLEVKPFKVLKVAMDVMRTNGLTILPQLDEQLAPNHVQQIYRLFDRPIPSRAAWDELLRES